MTTARAVMRNIEIAAIFQKVTYQTVMGLSRLAMTHIGVEVGYVAAASRIVFIAMAKYMLLAAVEPVLVELPNTVRS